MKILKPATKDILNTMIMKIDGLIYHVKKWIICSEKLRCPRKIRLYSCYVKHLFITEEKSS